jgi:hypothetical protein
MRFQNNVLEFDKNGTRYAQTFNSIVCDAFILDPYNSFKLIDGNRVPMTDEEIALANRFVNNFQPVISLDEMKISKKTEAKKNRQLMEDKGIIVNNMRVATDRDSQSMITSAFTYLTSNPTLTINWKGPNGFIPLDLTSLTEIANQVGSFIQGLFTKEQVTCQLIDAATTIEELNAVVIYEINKRSNEGHILRPDAPVV